ncbi:MAG: hypothetical protein K9K40_09940 [Desulfotignum sp.]|nr:hypothetical protein [Desulfotignum sp.]
MFIAEQTICLKRYSAISAVNAISFRIEHQCPQCGAPIVLDEETRFFACEFCRVKSCISQTGFARYMFARSFPAMSHPDAPDDSDLVFLPYWRFKGMYYTCTRQKVSHRFLDISALALEGSFPNLPVSLGFRSQALSLKQVTPHTRGHFFQPADAPAILAQVQSRSMNMKQPGHAGFSEQIGETLSLIYSPFYTKGNRLVDAILNQPIRTFASTHIRLDNLPGCRPEKQTVFLPGICPDCGWDLEGANDSLILICKNCSTLWKPKDRQLARIRFKCTRPKSDTDVMVPFWKIKAGISGLSLSSMADLARLANLPRAVRPEWENQELFFWATAFKIRPRIFLSLASRITLGQPAPDLDREIPGNRHVPVTLPADEAVQSIRITLAGLARPLTDVLPALVDLKITPVQAMLVFLAFEDQFHDYVHPGLKAGINKKALALASNL